VDLQQLLAGASLGEKGRVLAVAGGAGSGKSRFLREAAWRATTGGWQVGSAVCRDGGGIFDPIGRILVQLEASQPSGGDLDTLPGRLVGLARKGNTLLILDDVQRGTDATLLAVLMAAQQAEAARLPLAVLLAFDPEGLSPASLQRLAFAAG